MYHPRPTDPLVQTCLVCPCMCVHLSFVAGGFDRLVLATSLVTHVLSRLPLLLLAMSTDTCTHNTPAPNRRRCWVSGVAHTWQFFFTWQCMPRPGDNACTTPEPRSRWCRRLCVPVYGELCHSASNQVPNARNVTMQWQLPGQSKRCCTTSSNVVVLPAAGALSRVASWLAASLLLTAASSSQHSSCLSRWARVAELRWA